MFRCLYESSSGARQFSTSPPCPSRIVPGKTRRRQGVSRSAANDSAVGPPDHVGTMAGSYPAGGGAFLKRFHASTLALSSDTQAQRHSAVQVSWLGDQ